MCIYVLYIGWLMEYISQKVAAYGQFVLVLKAESLSTFIVPFFVPWMNTLHCFHSQIKHSVQMISVWFPLVYIFVMKLC